MQLQRCFIQSYTRQLYFVPQVCSEGNGSYSPCLQGAIVTLLPLHHADESSAELGEGAAQCFLRVTGQSHRAILQPSEATQQKSQSIQSHCRASCSDYRKLHSVQHGGCMEMFIERVTCCCTVNCL